MKKIGINDDKILQLPVEEDIEEDPVDDTPEEEASAEEQIFGISGPDEEAAAAYAAYMKKKAQKSAASVSASEKPEKNPAENKISVESLPKFDAPAKENAADKSKHSSMDGDPVKFDNLVKVETTVENEAIEKTEEPVKTEEDAKEEAPIKTEEAAKEEAPIKTVEAAKEEAPEKVEETEKVEEPTKAEEHFKEEGPALTIEPPETPEPEKTEEEKGPEKTEKPETSGPDDKTKEPEQTKEPEKTEEPKKEAETSEKFISQEEEDKESNRLAWIMISVAAGVVLLAVLAYIFIWGGHKPDTDETQVEPTTISGSLGTTEADTDEISTSESQSGPGESTTELIEDTEQYSLEYKINDADESVLALMTKYYNATADCDVDTIRNCYYDPEAIAIDENLLKRKAQIIDGYRGIKCYEADGLAADELVLYVLYEIKFKEVQTPAPTLIRFYLKKVDDEWRIYNGPMSEELSDHLNKMTNNRDVISLMVQVNRAFSQACDRDDELGRLIRLLGEEPETTTQAGKDEET